MEDRIVLVTGSSRGIGSDIALKLAERVGGVAVHYFSHKQAASGVVEAIRQTGKRSQAFCADLTNEKSATLLIQRVQKKFGRLDILINNFGPILVKPWKKVTAEEWETVYRNNLLSALFCMKSALPGMRRKKWGRIVNIGYSRVEELTAFTTITPYAIAKTGLLLLTRTVAHSEASKGITVNMVSPGLMEGGVLPKDDYIPSGRLGEFEDVSAAVRFLASEDAGYITGANLIVAGGWKL
ncbi:MAG: SDR family oxidoreductase [Candidatus Aminicenantes bacterium]|jgi:3-oxoacyl-[acyl-carrier protein] reductase